MRSRIAAFITTIFAVFLLSAAPAAAKMEPAPNVPSGLWCLVDTIGWDELTYGYCSATDGPRSSMAVFNVLGATEPGRYQFTWRYGNGQLITACSSWYCMLPIASYQSLTVLVDVHDLLSGAGYYYQATAYYETYN